jgi:16S rRNA (uracil1498-N3)-methyltransferase
LRSTTCFSDFLHRFEQFATRIRWPGVHARCVESTAILQFELTVVAEKVRCAHRTIISGNALLGIEQIRKGKIQFAGPALHVGKGIVRVGIAVVAHDGNAADAQRAQFTTIADQAVNDRLDVGAVIADEGDQQAVRAAAVGQAVAPAIGTRQFEITGRLTKIADRWIECRHDAPFECKFRRIIAPMNLPRFYCREALAPGAHVELPEPVARHAVRVLRLPPGAPMVLFDGRGGEYLAHIQRIERDRVLVELAGWTEIERESPLSVTLIQALQAGEKMDFTIQKAVELGVRDIVPVESRRSVLKLAGERAVKRVAHWQGVVAAACEQCGRNQVPLVAPLERLDRWLARPASGADSPPLRLLLAPDAKNTLADIAPATNVQLLIGAEGGLDPQEIVAAQQVGFQAVRMGPRVLRTETAGLAAMAVLQALWGDFKGG